MLKLSTAGVASAAALLFAATLAGPAAAAGTIYSWRTEDGVYAFTDDPKAIPVRYRDGAEKRQAAGLDNYARYTPQDTKASARYAERLAERLAYLREVNTEPPAPAQPVGPPVGQGASPTISLRAGSGDASPRLEIPAGESDEPIVVETLRYKPEGRMVTRHNVVVRQGGKTIAVVKQRLRGETNVVDDIRDEAELR